MDPAFRLSRRVSSMTPGIVLFLMLASGAAGCATEALSPTALPRREPLTISRLIPSVGTPGNTRAIHGTGFAGDTTVAIGNAPARVIVLSSEHMTVTSPVLEAGVADVVLTNPSGERAVLAGGYTTLAITLTPERTELGPGDQLAVSWSVSLGARRHDWIGLFEVGSPLKPFHEWGFAWEYTKGGSSGTWRFKPNAIDYPSGQYEFRYAVEGYSDEFSARSVPVTIR